jgi:hypothetical protein
VGGVEVLAQVEGAGRVGQRARAQELLQGCIEAELLDDVRAHGIHQHRSGGAHLVGDRQDVQRGLDVRAACRRPTGDLGQARHVARRQAHGDQRGVEATDDPARDAIVLCLVPPARPVGGGHAQRGACGRGIRGRDDGGDPRRVRLRGQRVGQGQHGVLDLPELAVAAGPSCTSYRPWIIERRAASTEFSDARSWRASRATARMPASPAAATMATCWPRRCRGR